uniref:Uncharacterized protein n=1 Tax=viral metagenome TaxID=1070528 RepID=A0A6C0EZU8_9ZZZZ
MFGPPLAPIETSLEVALNEKLVKLSPQSMLSPITVIVYVSLTFSGKTKLADPRYFITVALLFASNV